MGANRASNRTSAKTSSIPPPLPAITTGRLYLDLWLAGDGVTAEVEAVLSCDAFDDVATGTGPTEQQALDALRTDIRRRRAFAGRLKEADRHLDQYRDSHLTARPAPRRRSSRSGTGR